MKKIIALLMLFTFVFGTNVNASAFVELTEKLLSHHNIEVTDDLSGINRLQNRMNIKNPALISTAIKSGVIVAKNGVVNENGADLSPLADGLIKRYIADNSVQFISGKREYLIRSRNLTFYGKTFYVTENQSVEDINYTDIYTCIADNSNRVLFIWKAGDIVQPAIYKVKLYWLEENELYASEVYRKEYNSWIKESVDGSFAVMDASDVSVSESFILENLDKYVYVFADNYNGRVVVKGIAH